MPYSDLTLKLASQVAYKDFPMDTLKNKGRKPPFLITELLEYDNETIEKLEKTGQKPPYTAAQLIATAFPGSSEDEILRLSNWKIVDDYDNNINTGFYGCVIDIGDGNAVLGFRGSEGMLDLSNLLHDWIRSDFKLLNSTLTIQQGEVYKFLCKVANSDYIDNYKSLAMTGHSLGGNLAMHGAVVSLLPEINLFDKLERCVSYDGPGYSDEYLQEYSSLIDQASKKITHYKWSMIGGLLSSFPGSDRISLKYKENKSILYYLVSRHAIQSIEFDESENAVRGQETMWDILTSKFSKGLDHMPSCIGDIIVVSVSTVTYFTVWMINEMFDNKKITPFGRFVIISAVVFVVINTPIVLVVMVGKIILAVTAFFFTAVLYECIYEYIEELYELFEQIVNEIAKEITQVCEWMSDKYNELKNFIAKSLSDAKKWFKSNFDKGYKYASSHPIIKVDTYKLNNYAQRLRSINSRMTKLDIRLDSLYNKVGLLDILKLQQADMLTGFNWRLLRSADYLNKTATEYESLEKKLSSGL